MTPDMIHTGKLPQDVIAEEMDSIKLYLSQNGELTNMWKVCENAMKQYRRTRTEATRTGVNLARAAVKNDTIRFVHPLIIGEDPSRCSSDAMEKSDFVRHLQSFRPGQTIFESGIGTGAQSSQKGGNKSAKDSHGVEIMKALRREVGGALERNKVSLKNDKAQNETSDDQSHLVRDEYGDVITDETAETDEYNDDSGDHNHDMDDHTDENQPDQNSNNNNKIESSHEEHKRLSRAERKRIKKYGTAHVQPQLNNISDDCIISEHMNDKKSNNSNMLHENSYKDSKYFMSYGTEDEVANYAEESMQPQFGLKGSEAKSNYLYFC
jgi:hypothetical protein